MTGSAKIRTPFAPVRDLPAGPARTVDGLISLAPELRRLPVVCLHDGVPVQRADWATHDVGDGTGVELVILPMGGNGGFTDILRLVATLAVLIAAPYAGAAIAGALSVTSTIGVSLITAGFALAGTALINAILPVSTAKPQGSASPTYSLQGQGNYARLESPIPKTYGRHKFYPDFLTSPYTEYVANSQYLSQVFCLGLDSYDVESISLDDTVFWRKATGFTGALSGIEVQFAGPGEQITLVECNVATSSEVASQELKTTGEYLGPFAAVPPGSVAEAISVDASFPRGILAVGDDGKIRVHGCGLRFEARLIDDNGVALGDYFVMGAPFESGSSNQPRSRTYKYPVALGRYEVRAVRTTETEGIETKRTAQSLWTALRGHIPDPGRWKDVSALAIRVKASEQVSSSASRKINVVQTSKLRRWVNGAWTAPVASTEIAACVSDVLTHRYGGRLPDLGRVDWDTLWNVLQPKWTARGDTYSAVVDARVAVWDLVTEMLRVGRTKPLLVGSTVTFSRDEARTLARGVFTPFNMASESLSSEYVLFDKDAPADVLVQFTNAATWKEDSVRCFMGASPTTREPAKITLRGITNIQHAWREGIYQAAANRYRRKFSQFDTELEGRLLMSGDLISITHDVPSLGQSSELQRLGSFNGETMAVLMDEVAWAPGVQHYAIFRTRTGQGLGPIRVTQGASAAELVLVAADIAAAKAALGTSETLRQLLVETGDARDRKPSPVGFGGSSRVAGDWLVAVVEPGDDLAHTVTAVVDDPRVHTADQTYLAPPALPSVGNLGIGPPMASELTVTKVGSDGAPYTSYSVSWSAVPAAASYVAQVSYDNSSWVDVPVAVGNTSVVIPLEIGRVYLRVAARTSARGPFKTAEVVVQSAPAVPNPVHDLTSSADLAGGGLTISWIDAPRATAYDVAVKVAGVTKLTATGVSVPSAVFQSDAVIAAGGPWAAVTASVTARNAAGSAATTTVSLNVSMPAPANLRLLNTFAGTTASFSWDYVGPAAGYTATVIPFGGPAAVSSNVNALSAAFGLSPKMPAVAVNVAAFSAALPGVTSAPLRLEIVRGLTGFFEFSTAYPLNDTSNGATPMVLTGATTGNDAARGNVFISNGTASNRGTIAGTAVPAGSCSYACWVYLDDLTTNPHTVIGSSAGAANVRLHVEANVLKVTQRSTVTITYNLPSSWTAASWHHVAVTYDATTQLQTLYVDGAQVAQATVALAPSSGTTFRIGNTGTNASGLKGRVDNVAFGSVAWTLDEVNVLKNW